MTMQYHLALVGAQWQLGMPPLNFTEVRMIAFEIEKGVMLMAISAKPKAAARDRAEILDEAGKCIKCECDSEAKGEVRRKGLCPRCHYAYRMDRLQHPKDKRIVYDAKRMREGTLLESRQGKRIHKQEPVNA